VIQENNNPIVTKVVPRSFGGFVLFIFREIIIQRKWLLLPVWVVLAVIAIFLVIGGGSSLLPAIYLAF